MKNPSTYTRWMGRASRVTFMPTGVMSTGSPAPIENSPPETQTIPGGGGPGAGVRLGMVGPNESEAPVAIADIAQTTIKHATAIVDPLRFLDQSGLLTASPAPTETSIVFQDLYCARIAYCSLSSSSGC